MLLLRIVAFLVGFLGVLLTFTSAVRTVVVPRAESVILPRLVFSATGRVIGALAHRKGLPWAQRDRVLAHHAPFGLMMLAVTWIILVTLAFVPMFWAVELDGLREAARVSASSVTTLGFATTGTDWPGTVLSFAEAAIGLMLVALLISFLPTMYSQFSSRERTVAYMAVRAGTPPSAAELLERLHRIGNEDDLVNVWMRFEEWFNELAETHTSFLALSFFRSPNPSRSWITTAGAVLDAAAIHESSLNEPPDPRAALCIRAGYTALREIALAYRIEVPLDPAPADPISVTQVEFDLVLDRLATAGVPITGDRQQAWLDYRGWRVNYDMPLVNLCTLVTAPDAPWSSDRQLPLRRTPVRLLVGRSG